MGKWIDALRSGEIKQGMGALKQKNGGYCCMGARYVVEDLPFRKNENGDTVAADYNMFFPGNKYSEQWDLKTAVTDEEDNIVGAMFPGVESHAGDDRMALLSYLNDSIGASFSEIADVLEKLGWDNSDG